MNNWNMKRIFCLLTIFFCTLFAFNASAQEERIVRDVEKESLFSWNVTSARGEPIIRSFWS